MGIVKKTKKHNLTEHLANANKEILRLNSVCAELDRQNAAAIDLVTKTKAYYCAIIDICIQRYGALSLTKEELNKEILRLGEDGQKSYIVLTDEDSYTLKFED